MRIAVCEDDKQTCLHLGSLVREAMPEANLELFTNAEELLSSGCPPEIVLMDIELDGMDGMEAARCLRRQGSDCEIIFVTGKDQYVFGAFDVNAAHYLLKPVQKEKLTEVLKKAALSLASTHDGAWNRHLLITSKGAHVRVPVSDILFAEVFNRIVVLHTTNGEIRYYGRLSELEKQCGETFFRTHRSYLVNMRYVESYAGNTARVGESTVPISKKQYPAFVTAFLEYIREMKP